MTLVAWLLAIGMGACAVGWFWAVSIGGPFRPIRNELSEVLQGTFLAAAVLVAVVLALG